MSQKGKKRPVKTDSPGPAKPVVEKKAAPLSSKPGISTLEDARALVKKSYLTEKYVDYIVLSNGNVFYGPNRPAALKYARKFELELFDVKF